MSSNTDRIEKQVLLRAPLQHVWRAISDSKQFGSWFGVEFDQPFVVNTRITGKLAPTKVDPEVAKTQQPYAGYAFEFFVDRIEPMRMFSFRWHPFAIEVNVDYSKEPTTLVTFELEEVADGTMLTISESGFDRIPLGRRANAFARNDAGWTAQAKLIEKFIAHAA